jgi:hypothetical protein
MAAPRQDRRTKTKNVWGEDGITFPLSDAACPAIVDTKTFRMSQLPGSIGVQLPAFGSAHPDTANFPNAYATDIDVEPGEGTDQNVTLKYETLPGTWIYSTHLAEDSAVVTTAKRRVLAGTVMSGESAAGGTLTKTTENGINNVVSEEVVETRELPGNILTDYDQEDETQALITTTFQIVANPVSAPTATPGVIVKVKHIDDYNSWLITETRTTPAGWTYQENAAFHFPTLFNAPDYAYTDVCGAFADNRDGFSVNVQMLIVVSFSNTVDEFTGLQLLPKTLQLGKYVSFNDCLVSAGSFTYFGSCTGTVTFGASSPSYDAYLALVATAVPQLIGGSSKKTRYGDFRTEKLYVLLV